VTHRDEQRLTDIVTALGAIQAHLLRGGLDDGMVFDAVRIRLLEIGDAGLLRESPHCICPDCFPVAFPRRNDRTETPHAPNRLRKIRLCTGMGERDQRSDGLLVMSEEASDAGRFIAFVRPHWVAMSRLAARLSRSGDWEDILQEALSLAWRKRSQFDESRGSPRAWLLMLTADQARKARRVSLQPDALDETVLPAVSSVENQRDLDLERALEALSKRQRLAVELYYYVGLPVIETAAVMRCSEGTVKSTLADARRRLREILGDDFRG
jgi:RNA polymerase sigma factor (sigma-70 family)